MRSTPLLIEATVRDAYIVSVRFEDGTAGDIDLSYLAEYGGVFEPLKDPESFRRLRADEDAGTIVWPTTLTSLPRRSTRMRSASRRRPCSQASKHVWEPDIAGA